MTFQTIEIYPNRSVITFLHAPDDFWRVELIEDNGSAVTAYFLREQLSALYLAIGKELFPDDPDAKELSAKIDALTKKIDNQLELFANGKS